MNREEEEMSIAILKQEIEMSENEFKARISRFYNDCVNIFGRINDRMYELEKLYRRNTEL
jgi:hypothetical protein